MGTITKEQPKCMTELYKGETILSRQLKQLNSIGINKIIMTTGAFNKILEDYCQKLNLSFEYTFVFNPVYYRTNYIYSIYLAREFLDDDIILMHGDLVFDKYILESILRELNSCMIVSSTVPLPEKDFKAVVKRGRIKKIGIDFFDSAVTAQPLYKLNKKDWMIWLDSIVDYCEKGEVTCYAENAFNEVSDLCRIHPYDIEDMLCTEVDNPEDLGIVKRLLGF